MQTINQIIYCKVKEIIVLVLFIIGATYISFALNDSMVLKIPELIPNSLASVHVLKNNNYALYPMNDEYAKNYLMPTSVQITNSTHQITNYAFGLKVSKDSTVNYKNLKISFRNNVSLLSDYYYKEDESYYYFLLESGQLKGGSLLYDFKIWLDNEVISSENQLLKYEFVNLRNIL